MNSQYSFDEKYLTCVVTHMSEQKPFGDVPSKVSTAVQRAMTANRAVAKSLKAAYDIMESIKMVRRSFQVMVRELTDNDFRPRCPRSA